MYILLQDTILDSIYDAYHAETGSLVVPDSLKMKKDSNHKEVRLLNAYRPKNRYELNIK